MYGYEHCYYCGTLVKNSGLFPEQIKDEHGVTRPCCMSCKLRTSEQRQELLRKTQKAKEDEERRSLILRGVNTTSKRFKTRTPKSERVMGRGGICTNCRNIVTLSNAVELEIPIHSVDPRTDTQTGIAGYQYYYFCPKCNPQPTHQYHSGFYRGRIADSDLNAIVDEVSDKFSISQEVTSEKNLEDKISSYKPIPPRSKPKQPETQKPMCSNCSSMNTVLVSEFVKTADERLAEELSAPKEPSRLEETFASGNTARKFWNILTGVGIWYGFYFLLSNELWIAVSAITVVFLIRYGSQRVFSIIDRKPLQRWRNAKSKWQALYYCKNCNRVFNPTVNYSMPVEATYDYLMK